MVLLNRLSSVSVTAAVKCNGLGRPANVILSDSIAARLVYARTELMKATLPLHFPYASNEIQVERHGPKT